MQPAFTIDADAAPSGVELAGDVPPRLVKVRAGPPRAGSSLSLRGQ